MTKRSYIVMLKPQGGPVDTKTMFLNEREMAWWLETWLNAGLGVGLSPED